MVMFAGFAFGRASGSSSLPRLVGIHKDFPLFPAPPKSDALPATNVSTMENDIVVEVPVDGMIVADSFLDVAGRAKIAGGPLRVRLKDAAGTVLAESDLEIIATDNTSYGRFGKTLSFTTTLMGSGTVELGRTSGVGATIVRQVRLGVAPMQPGLTVKVYFAKMGDDSDCGIVYSTERSIDDKSAAFRGALGALLQGPTAEEKALGYVTSIPAGVILKSAVADASGTITADFTKTLERGVTGACRVSRIRSQIEATLRQFPEVHDVVISVNGKPSAMLQP